MKKQVIIGLLMIMSAMSGLHAQDTIDTNYYRYDNHFIYPYILGNNPWIEGFQTACPNGMGFYNYTNWLFDDRMIVDDTLGYQIDLGSYIRRENGYLVPFDTYYNYNHMVYQLSGRGQSVYGIAFALDTIFNLTEGDSMTAILCTLSADRTRFVDLDSITIKGGEIGKRRWIEIPIADYGDGDTSFTLHGPYEDCIDTVMYRQVLELYFDGRSYTIDDDILFWKLRVSDSNGSRFYGSIVRHPYSAVIFAGIEDGELIWQEGRGCWDFLFPVLSPLPEWEEPSICQIVPDAQKPNTPDNPHDPDDPQDPDDPDDPDNPGGDEGIGDVDGGLQSAVSLRPNPSSGVTTVSCAEAISELTVRDMAGRVVLRKAACGTTATFDTSTLRKGVYLVKVTTARGTITKKLVVE